MKKFFVTLVVLIAVASVKAQLNVGGVPAAQTFSLNPNTVPTFELDAIDLERIAAEDDADEKNGNYPKIARFLPVGIGLGETDHWETLPNGDRVWRLRLLSDYAQALSVQFEDFFLPRGAHMYLYTPDFSHVIGGFTTNNNHESGMFSTQLIVGSEVIVEYREPASAAGQGRFTVSGAFHAYRMVQEVEVADRDFGDSDPCHVNVNCSEGSNWQNQKRGVVRIFVVEGAMGGWCSGSLINNTQQDCRSFLLTALHCGQNATTANMNQWVFYFNYEAPGCVNPSSQGNLAAQTLTGCARRADSGDNGGDNGSDFMLVELNTSIPANYNAYFNGWRRNNVTSSSGFSIHHPAGDIKKISTYTSALQSTNWGSAAGSHWLVVWAGTANGHGVTEGGSSGSPIFDNQGLIIGTLTGGSSFCNTPTWPDLYGKMSYHWSSNPGDNLSTWLDPLSSGVTSLQGIAAPCGSGVPDCSASIPYPLAHPCVVEVISDDPFCCESSWDEVCEEAYQDCISGGLDECLAGSVSSPLSQEVCPSETAMFNASGANIPPGGGYALGFASAGGTGGAPGGFTLTGVDFPWDFNNGLNGILAANSLPPLSGQWVVVGIAYSNAQDIDNSVCGTTSNQLSVNFLPASHPNCQGAGCPAGEVADCNGNCAPSEWIGDDYCDDGTYQWNGTPIFFNCAEFNNDEGDCDDTSVGDRLVRTGSFWLFPNPASDHATWRYVAGSSETIELDVLNTHGSYVHRSTVIASGEFSQQIDVSGLAAGIYVVRVRTSKGVFTRKLVVARR